MYSQENDPNALEVAFEVREYFRELSTSLGNIEYIVLLEKVDIIIDELERTFE